MIRTKLSLKSRSPFYYFDLIRQKPGPPLRNKDLQNATPSSHFPTDFIPHISAAYKHADGKKIDGKRVLVDVERARTVKGWLPRRLGGGLGGTRRGGNDVNIKHSGREDNERERERYRLEQRDRDERGTRTRGDAPAGGGGGARRRSRSRSRSRRRSASRPRRRDRERERDRDRRPAGDDEGETGGRRRRRSGSRSRRRREERGERGERGERNKDRSRSRSRDRKRDRSRKEKVKHEIVKVKQEPVDDFPEFTLPPFGGVQIKQEPEDDNKYDPHEEGY